MKLRNGISITKSKNGEWWSNIEGAWKVYHDGEELSNIVGLYRVFKKKTYDDSLKLEYLTNVKRWFDNKNGIVSDTTNELTAEQNKVKLEETLTKGFTDEEKETLCDFIIRMKTNLEKEEKECTH